MLQLENLILQYENDFFNAEFCRDKNNVTDRLCTEFFEYGKSGTIHKRNEIIDSLSSMKQDRDIDIHNFTLSVLSGDVVAAHYISHEKTANIYALRTSIWKNEDGFWKMLFHQGTSCKN